MDDIITQEHRNASHRLKTVYATYKKSEDMINIRGLYEGVTRKLILPYP